MNRSTSNGSVLIIVLIVITIFGSLFVLRPKMLDGDSRRAKASQEATQQVKTTTAKVDAAVDHQSAVAAASVVKIGEAAQSAPPSPERDFQIKETSVALANLPKPDPDALLAAEQRKVAVMEGRLDETARLYAEASKTTKALTLERDAALTARSVANAQRDAIDQRLTEVAAARLAAERQVSIAVVAVILLAGLWIYTKLFQISPATLGRIAADVRAGASPISSMDEHLAPWLHAKVRKASQLATPPNDSNVNSIGKIV